MLQIYRVVTVKTIEAIMAWRKSVESTQAMSRKAGKEAKLDGSGRRRSSASAGEWVVKVAVTGDRLFKGCAAFTSNIKRLSRAPTKSKKALVMRYLGRFPTQMEAEMAYDNAIKREAIRMQVPVQRMPEKRIVERTCGKHFAVESQGYEDSVCEECVVKSFESNGGGQSTNAAFMYNGINYLLKMLCDIDFTDSIEPLRLWLGKLFPLTRNPLVLYHSLREYVSMTSA